MGKGTGSASTSPRISVIRSSPGPLVVMVATAFEHPQALLTRLSARDQGCVVLDLHLPGLDGFAVQAALHRRGSTLPVLVITGVDQPASRRRAMALGARGCLRKPVDGEQLLAAIGAAVRAGPP